MSVSERWARTQDQVELMQRARVRGGQCSWCGRVLDDGQTVYVEYFLTGEERARWSSGESRRGFAYAPVGAECASPELLAQTEGQEPAPCASCGRGVFYRHHRSNRQQVTCSRRCARLLAAARQGAKRDVGRRD
jgi:hypothetical protein